MPSLGPGILSCPCDCGLRRGEVRHVAQFSERRGEACGRVLERHVVRHVAWGGQVLPRARGLRDVKGATNNTVDRMSFNIGPVGRYCREPGVRNLQKQVEKLLRKVALQIATKQATR